MMYQLELGHSDIKITQQYYAKVIPTKIMRDMQKLEERLEKKRLEKIEKLQNVDKASNWEFVIT